MSPDRHNIDHPTEEHWLLHLIDQLSLRRWLSLWVGTIFVSAIFYWFASVYMAGHGIHHTTQGRMDGLISFPTALYFSCVTTTTLGYGDLAPEGASRIVVIMQAFLGMIIVGVIISKILSRHQEQMILDTKQIALAERAASVLTALNVQLIEFQELSIAREQTDRAAASDERFLRRWENAELRFSFLLGSVHQLLRTPAILASTKSKILKALDNTVVEFVAASKACDSPIAEETTTRLQGICGCPKVQKDLTDDQSLAEIMRCLSSKSVTK